MKDSKLASLLIIAFSISFLIAFPVLVLVVLGIGVDALFHTGHTFAITGAIIGFLGSFINVYRFLKKFLQH